jgi:PadR family transcriptional regulator PadR
VADDIEVIQGTLNVLILQTLSWRPMNGYAIAQWIHEVTRGDIEIEEGALYPALHRMEQKGWLASDWGYTEQSRRARYYRLTAAGRRQLTAELSRWSRYTEAMTLVLTAEPAR